MSKSSNQKLKILRLADYLYNFSDEEHPVSMSDIISHLESYGIKAERKSIYDDIEALKIYGYDVIFTKQYGGGYYIGERRFELAELKLLVDAVQSCRFITAKKSAMLIKKIAELANEYDEKELHREVVVNNRVKTENESIYYNVDAIHKAIREDKMITFNYMEWTLNKKLEPKNKGVPYRKSPMALLWNDGNYYLIAYDHDQDMIKHYRVDKMKNIGLTDDTRKGKEKYKNFDLAKYSQSTFGMFGGEEQELILTADPSMIGVILDRFGQDVSYRHIDDTKFQVRIKVVVSQQFYGWLCGLAGHVKITAPESEKKAFEEYIKKCK